MKPVTLGHLMAEKEYGQADLKSLLHELDLFKAERDKVEDQITKIDAAILLRCPFDIGDIIRVPDKPGQSFKIVQVNWQSGEHDGVLVQYTATCRRITKAGYPSMVGRVWLHLNHATRVREGQP